MTDGDSCLAKFLGAWLLKYARPSMTYSLHCHVFYSCVLFLIQIINYKTIDNILWCFSLRLDYHGPVATRRSATTIFLWSRKICFTREKFASNI